MPPAGYVLLMALVVAGSHAAKAVAAIVEKKQQDADRMEKKLDRVLKWLVINAIILNILIFAALVIWGIK